MQKRIITQDRLKNFEKILYKDEKSQATIEKYLRDVRRLENYLNGRELTKEILVQYKEDLQCCGNYKIASINSYLAAANHFCECMGWAELRVKSLKMQREIFQSENQHLTKEEYKRLVKTAYKSGKIRLALIMETIASTGIRVSELSFISVCSLEEGMTDIYNKGKMRKVIYPKTLVKILKNYVQKNGIMEGAVFQTASGKPVDRANIWKEMKQICNAAGVDERKVYPHNLRHLFARAFYQIKKDIAKLADVLGHSNIETTRIYIKSTGNEHRKQLDAMEMIVTT